MEESKSLSSLQVAGLQLQSSLHFLTTALKSYNKRRQVKSFSTWRYLTLILPKQAQFKIKNSFLAFNMSFKAFIKTLSYRSRLTLQDSLLRIISRSKLLQIDKNLHKNEESLKILQQKELQTIAKDLKNMQDHQDDLEKNLKKMKTREESFKSQIQEISIKKNEVLKNRKKAVKGKEEQISEKIEELKEENTDIREKIAMIEGNVASFIGEMGGLLEVNDSKGSEKRRPSIKKTKLTKKGRIPLFTVDVSKN